LFGAGCAAAIPTRPPLVGPPRGAPGPALEMCLLVAEQHDRFQAEGIAELSLAPWRQAIASIVIRHPRGLVVLDPAYARTTADEVRRAPLAWAPIVGRPEDKTPLAGLLERAGIDPSTIAFALVTHAHWDHLSGLADLPEARVILRKTELEWARKRRRFESGVLFGALHVRRSRWSPFEFEDRPHEGFERSFDVFGDGAIVAVPLPGHTPGSVGYFVRDASGKELLLIGDAAWSEEGFRRPAHKNAFARALVDWDLSAAAQTLSTLHALAAARPDLTLVPAHDLTALEAIPACRR
jgi:glyoxylase-like metal-dependent hydrolase (beta-lactamase superfamily II)